MDPLYLQMIPYSSLPRCLTLSHLTTYEKEKAGILQMKKWFVSKVIKPAMGALAVSLHLQKVSRMITCASTRLPPTGHLKERQQEAPLTERLLSARG